MLTGNPSVASCSVQCLSCDEHLFRLLQSRCLKPLLLCVDAIKSWSCYQMYTMLSIVDKFDILVSVVGRGPADGWDLL
jgi:hypothetical protein